MAREAVSPKPFQVDEGIDALLERQAESPLWRNFRRLLHKKLAMVALTFIIIFYLAGITAPILAKTGVIPGYTQQDLENALQGPSLSHPFGTDRLGRDQLSRVIWSAQTTVIITVATLAAGTLFLGVSLGLLAGYVGGWVDTAIVRIGDIFASLPSLLLLILINATLKERIRGVASDFEDFTHISGIVRS